MAETKKLLHDCPNCSYQFKAEDYIASSAICRACNKSFPKNLSNPGFFSKNRKYIVSLVLILGLLNFSVLIYKNWGSISKQDSKVSSYIKKYWNDLEEENLIRIIQDCNQSNDYQCQVLAYEKLKEIDPTNEFYKKTYEAKLKKYKNPPKLDPNIQM